jgi:hypothetical protein
VPGQRALESLPLRTSTPSVVIWLFYLLATEVTENTENTEKKKFLVLSAMILGVFAFNSTPLVRILRLKKLSFA